MCVGSNQGALGVSPSQDRGTSAALQKGHRRAPPLGPQCPALPSAVWAPWCLCCPGVCPCLCCPGLCSVLMPHPPSSPGPSPLNPDSSPPLLLLGRGGGGSYSFLLGRYHSHQGTMSEDGQFSPVTMQRRKM